MMYDPSEGQLMYASELAQQAADGAERASVRRSIERTAEAAGEVARTLLTLVDGKDLLNDSNLRIQASAWEIFAIELRSRANA